MQWGCLIMGERGCAAASLWLEHAPSIGLAIGPRQYHYHFKNLRNVYYCHLQEEMLKLHTISTTVYVKTSNFLCIQFLNVYILKRETLLSAFLILIYSYLY